MKMKVNAETYTIASKYIMWVGGNLFWFVGKLF